MFLVHDHWSRFSKQRLSLRGINMSLTLKSYLVVQFHAAATRVNANATCEVSWLDHDHESWQSACYWCYAIVVITNRCSNMTLERDRTRGPYEQICHFSTLLHTQKKGAWESKRKKSHPKLRPVTVINTSLCWHWITLTFFFFLLFLFCTSTPLVFITSNNSPEPAGLIYNRGNQPSPKAPIEKIFMRAYQVTFGSVYISVHVLAIHGPSCTSWKKERWPSLAKPQYEILAGHCASTFWGFF